VENVQQQIKDLEEEKQTLKTDVERSKSEKKEQESLLRALIPGFTEIKNKLLACQVNNNSVLTYKTSEIAKLFPNGLTRSVHCLLVAANVNIEFSWTRVFKVKTLVHCN
jgi:hypothetical protein